MIFGLVDGFTGMGRVGLMILIISFSLSLVEFAYSSTVRVTVEANGVFGDWGLGIT